MFHSARITLTAWYLLIIMVISVSFSLAIYRVLSLELQRLERNEEIRIERRLPNAPPVFLNPEVLAETKQRVEITLILINLIILTGSAYAGHILAGRTLNPIKKMVDDQNRFITDASHELRTPLTSLKAEIEVNLRDPHLTLGQTKTLLKSNLEEVNSLQVLSDSLIRLTQYQEGRNNIPVTTIHLAELMKESVRKVTNAAKEKHITITNDVRGGTLEGNPTSLTELFVIFLDNAIKYSAKQKTIHLSNKKADGHMLINIEDHGGGIAEQDIPHLFDRFYRADKSRTKSSVPGYGLGLAIAKEIVEHHKGTIKVSSKLNKGTTFTIELPIKQTEKFV